MSEAVIELDDTAFDETLHNSDVPVMVHFWAPWCGPCKLMSPMMEELADEYAGKAKICGVNTEQTRDTAIEFGVSAIPTLILFKNGQIQKKWVGLASKKDLSLAIEGLL